MEKVDMKELCPCQDKERYHELGSALEGCVHFNEDYKMLLLYIEQGRLAYGGYNPRPPTCTDVEDGILSKKRGNDDRNLDNRKQRIDMEIVPGKEQKIKDGTLGKKQRNEDRDLDNRKQRIDMEIVPGKERDKQRIDMEIVPGKEQTMNDGILSKRRGNKDRGLDNRNHRVDVNIIPGREQKIQNDSKFMDVEVKIEPQEDSDSIKEAESESEVEILENVGAEVGWGSSSNPFVPSVERCLNLDATIINSRYRKEVLNLLMTPYNGEEYKKLWKDIRKRLPSSSRNGRKKSLLSLHKGRPEMVHLKYRKQPGRPKSDQTRPPTLEVKFWTHISPSYFSWLSEQISNFGGVVIKPTPPRDSDTTVSKTQSDLPPAANPCAPTCRLEPSDYRYSCLTRQRVSYLSISLLARFFFQQGHPSILSRSTLVALDSEFVFAVDQEIKRAGPDKDKKLNIMRGFFFWLEHLTRQDAFQPWEDAECLQTLPGSP